jgi:hypothetical protein
MNECLLSNEELGTSVQGEDFVVEFFCNFLFRAEDFLSSIRAYDIKPAVMGNGFFEEPFDL